MAGKGPALLQLGSHRSSLSPHFLSPCLHARARACAYAPVRAEHASVHELFQVLLSCIYRFRQTGRSPTAVSPLLFPFRTLPPPTTTECSVIDEHAKCSLFTRGQAPYLQNISNKQYYYSTSPNYAFLIEAGAPGNTYHATTTYCCTTAVGQKLVNFFQPDMSQGKKEGRTLLGGA